MTEQEKFLLGEFKQYQIISNFGLNYQFSDIGILITWNSPDQENTSTSKFFVVQAKKSDRLLAHCPSAA